MPKSKKTSKLKSPSTSQQANDVAQLRGDQCAKCGSKNSKPVGAELVQHVRGDIFAARPLLEIGRQRVRCGKCGQVRMQRRVTPVPMGR